MQIEILKIGSDAELFLANAQGEPVPVCGLVGGTKEEPLPVLGGNGYAVQEDNVMLEFNIPAASNADEFKDSMCLMLSYLTIEMRKKALDIQPVSYKMFRASDLESAQARTFGCEPDFDVWGRKPNKPPSPEQLADSAGRMPRCAGFHIHVSYNDGPEGPSLETSEYLVKALDLWLGLPSLFIDTGTNRRKMYGRAGCFRLKPYGVEYRVLGSGLLYPAVFPWIYKSVYSAAAWLNAQTPEHTDMNLHGVAEYIVQAINAGDLRRAESIMHSFGVPKPVI